MKWNNPFALGSPSLARITEGAALGLGAGISEVHEPFVRLDDAFSALFQEAEWPADQAIWMLSTGRLLAGDHSPQARALRKTFAAASRRIADERTLPPEAQAWIESLRGDPENDWQFVALCRQHDWIRWAIQKRLPVHPLFWSLLNHWKAENWKKGVLWATFEHAIGDMVLYETPPIPAEQLWHLPFKWERTSLELGGEVQWNLTWRIDRDQLIDAMLDEKARVRLTTPKRASDSKRLRSVGGPALLHMAFAVHTLAHHHGVEAAADGLFSFPVERDQLIAELRSCDPKLAKLSIGTFDHALPAIVTSKLGRRPR